MNRPETTARLDAVRKAVASMPTGATLIDVAVRLSPPAAQRNIQRWLGTLVDQGEIVRIGGSYQSRYRLRDGADACKVPDVSPVGQSIWRVVNQPIAERAPSEYHRVWLDWYRPNQTYFMPEAVRTRLRSLPPSAAGAASSPAWRNPTVFSRLAADLAWRSGWLEEQMSDTPGKRLSLAEVTAWLAQPESNQARPEVQLLWNQRTALNVLLHAAPNVVLSHATLTSVLAALSKRLVRSVVVMAQGRPTVVAPETTLLRTDAQPLVQTVYRPPSDPWLIASCCNQVLGWAPAIADPIEQAFFVLVHLFYLQPFARLNASLTCLAVNIPLLRAGLPPVTFASVDGAALLDALRGVWELNRTELLRDLFIQAYDESRMRYR